MYQPSRLGLLLVAVLTSVVFGQQAKSPAELSKRTTASAVTVSADAAEVLALEKRIEEAVVHSDVAYVASVLASDFSFVHGDGWTTGGKPLASDDRAAFLKRVADKEYLVHDLDSVKIEMHGDIAITYGRYVSLYMPPNRNTANPAPANPARLNSIWFERVYAKRNGQWQFLSHRTVHGPTVSPAGIDPSGPPAAADRP